LVGRSVGRLVGWSVSRSVGRLVGMCNPQYLIETELKQNLNETRIDCLRHSTMRNGRFKVDQLTQWNWSRTCTSQVEDGDDDV